MTLNSATSTLRLRKWIDMYDSSIFELIFENLYHSFAFYAYAASAANLSASSLANLSCSAILSLNSLSNSSFSSGVISLLLIFSYWRYFIQISFFALSPSYSLIGFASKFKTRTARLILLRTSILAIWFYLTFRYFKAGRSGNSVKSVNLFFLRCNLESEGRSLIPFNDEIELSAKYRFFSWGHLTIFFKELILFPLNSKVYKVGWP